MKGDDASIFFMFDFMGNGDRKFLKGKYKFVIDKTGKVKYGKVFRSALSMGINIYGAIFSLIYVFNTIQSR